MKADLPPSSDSPLLAAPGWLDRPAIVDPHGHGPRPGVRTWRQIHAQSIALGERLAGATAVFNLCTSRAGFLIAFIAALRQRCLLILPPSGASADLSALVEATARPVVVGDAEACAEPWCAGHYLRCAPPWSCDGADDPALAWRPAWDETAVRLYTSGSSGTPQPQPKTLRHLTLGARVLGARLDADIDGGLASIGGIVCSVPPQHMFGLECSVMLPLVHGLPVLEGRPLLPADVRSACAEWPRAAWIATPLHLRGLVQTPEAAPACAAIVVSTMPLTRAVAQASERLTRAPVLEIYGSTETGALAMRRPARDSRWRSLAGVGVEAGAGEAVAHGSHFASPARLLDELAVDADGSFALLGRHADLVKIGGRRASLAGLNLLLQDLPGLEDGVFYLPATGSPTERLCLIHSGPPLDRAATRRWLRERVDPVFLPRAFIRVDRLPRGDGGKLHRQQLDRVFAAWQSTPQAPPAAPRGAAAANALRSR